MKSVEKINIKSTRKINIKNRDKINMKNIRVCIKEINNNDNCV